MPVTLKDIREDRYHRLIPAETFYRDMMGRSRMWYYRHKNDEGLPRPVYVGRQAYIVYGEAVDYVEGLIAAREPGVGQGS